MSISIGKSCVIDDSALIGDGSFIGDFIDIRKNVVIGERCTLICHNILSQGTILGDKVFLAPGVIILGRDSDNKRSCTKIGDNVFIGAGSIVSAGVEIGAGTKIGALSFVDKDCAPYSFYYGQPAKFVRKIIPSDLGLERGISG